MPESLLPLAHAQWGKQRRRRRRCCPSVGTKKKKASSPDPVPFYQC